MRRNPSGSLLPVVPRGVRVGHDGSLRKAMGVPFFVVADSHGNAASIPSCQSSTIVIVSRRFRQNRGFDHVVQTDVARGVV